MDYQNAILKLTEINKYDDKSLYLAISMAIDALKKQEDMTLLDVVHPDYKQLGKNYFCPNCGVMFYDWENISSRTNYCGNCGQKLDLGDQTDDSKSLPISVIRCKDCTHYTNPELGWCDIHSHLNDTKDEWNLFLDNDYCSFGEAKGAE